MISLGYYQLSLKIDMIRANQSERIGRIEELQYRNASYQGELKDSHFYGGGIVYFHDDNHIVACNRFQQSCINGSAFFIYDRSNYHFGEWRNNSPNGISVFRIGETVIVAQYKNGSIREGSRAFVLLQAHNVGVVASVKKRDYWQIRQKREVYCLEQIESLVSKCNFNCQNVQLSLFRFISHRLNTAPFKLRLINNKSFVFGIEDGISICFDQQQHIFQIQANGLNPSQKGSTGVSPIKAGQVYSSSILMTNMSRFRNKALKDPSRGYFDQLTKILDQGMVKAILSGFILDPSSLSKSPKNAVQNSLIIPKFQTGQQSQQICLSPTANQSKQMPFNQENYSKLDLKFDLSSKIIALQRPTARREIESSLAKSKMLRQPVKLFSFHQSPPKKQSNIQEFQLQPSIHNSQDQKIQNKRQITLERSPEPTGKIQQVFTTKKIKKKIFDSPTSKKQVHDQSLNKRAKTNQSRSRNHRIFTPNENKLSSEGINESDSNIKQRPASPIFALKSDALKTHKSKDDMVGGQDKNQCQLIQLSPGKAGHLKRDPNGKKRALTQFEFQSDIVSEDMSNLLDLNNNNSVQVNESPARKLKKHNEIYRGEEGKEPKKIATTVRANDNSPYLALPMKTQFSRSHAAVISRRPKTSHNGPVEKRYNYL